MGENRKKFEEEKKDGIVTEREIYFSHLLLDKFLNPLTTRDGPFPAPNST